MSSEGLGREDHRLAELEAGEIGGNYVEVAHDQRGEPRRVEIACGHARHVVGR